MKVKCSMIFFAFVFCAVVRLSAQDLEALIANIEAQVVSVQTATKTFDARIQSRGGGVVLYGFDQVDSKGNRVAHSYEFNLADIDPYAVREQTQKDAIYSVLAVRNKQKLVKVVKNGAPEPYENEVTIISKDIETARSISDAVKKAIPLAEKTVAGRLKLSGYDAMVNWLTSNVKDVNNGLKKYSQTLTKADRVGSLVFKEVTTDSKASSEEVYTFNLADINLNTISFKVTGDRFAINFETVKKDKFVSVRKNGEVKPYVSEVSITTNSVDGARDLKTVLTMVVPLAVEKVKADIPVIASEKDGLQNIKKQVTDLKVGAKQITQHIEAECICKFTQTESDAKSTESNVFKFNWMDLNPALSVIDVTGDKLFIELQTIDKKKMISHLKNDKFDGYETSVKLFMPDIEAARRMKAAVDKSIEKCKGYYKEPFGSDASSAITWLRQNLKEVTLEDETHKQSVEQVEDDKIEKLKFTSRELNSKGTGAEQVYEFSLADVNPLSIQLEAKGKWLYVTFEAEFKNKIFKYYKDGKIQPYASTLQFAVNDIEFGRNVAGALKKSVTALKGK